ncbi:MAG: serine/threonine protein kinase [Planctomycetaceae bacterium]
MKFLKELFTRKSRVEKVDITRRFVLIGRVGQGSMSQVWRARDTITGRTVALKVLDRDKLRRLDSRFLGLDKPSEGEVAVDLKHPNIVNTYEHGITTDIEQFLVMEFVEGVGLSYLVDVQNEVMQKNRLRLMIELGRALAYFHQHNWIHRDICPRNVIITRENTVKLIDFGLVVPNTPDFQQPGNRTGTAHYMAPELIKRQTTDQRIDVFAYGLTCYEMFTRRLPWDYTGESIDAVVQTINVPPKHIRQFVPDIDEQLSDAIMRCVDPDRDLRWQKMTEMLTELEAARARLEPDSKPSPSPSE